MAQLNKNGGLEAERDGKVDKGQARTIEKWWVSKREIELLKKRKRKNSWGSCRESERERNLPVSLKYWKSFLWDAVQHFLHPTYAILHHHIRETGSQGNTQNRPMRNIYTLNKQTAILKQPLKYNRKGNTFSLYIMHLKLLAQSGKSTKYVSFYLFRWVSPRL